MQHDRAAESFHSVQKLGGQCMGRHSRSQRPTSDIDQPSISGRACMVLSPLQAASIINQRTFEAGWRAQKPTSLALALVCMLVPWVELLLRRRRKTCIRTTIKVSEL